MTLTQEDVTGTRYHGTKLNLTGGAAGWATMAASVHSVSFDVASGTTSIAFGPAPYLAAEDFLELQRLLRGRPVTWMFDEERTSNELGAEFNPGSKGDTVSGYDIPETTFEPSAASGYPATIVPERFVLDTEGESSAWKVIFTPAKFWEHSLHRPGFGHPIQTEDPGGALSDDSTEDPRPELPLTVGANDVWLKWGIEESSKVEEDSVFIVIGAEPESEPYEPERPNGGTVAGSHVQKVGTITVVDLETEPTWKPECTAAKFDIFEAGIENTGAGLPVYNVFDSGTKKDKLKTFMSTEGDGEPILIDYEDDTVWIAKVKERDESGGAGYPQIKVVTVGEAPQQRVEIQGNGTFLNLSGYRLDSLQVRDGLVIGGTVQADGGETAEGGNFDIVLHRWTINVLTGASEGSPCDVNINDYGSDSHTLYVRRGLVYRDSADIPEGSPASEGTYNLMVWPIGTGTGSLPDLWDPAE